ncbi:MAG: flagellin FliC [Magnetococcales bacterium]|nr:flagellin FliC [Magnetococcales bacterium]
MSLVINTNIASLNAQRKLMGSTRSLGTSFQRLSSGLRINAAKDDAAGMSISHRMTAQVRGLNQAMRNTNDAISLVQVAEGALDETTNSLQRIRELSVQAANDTLVSSDREDIWKEVNQLLEEVDRIANQTEYNGQGLLGSTAGSTAAANYTAKFHIGNNADQTMDIAIQNAGTSAVGMVRSDIGSGTDMTALTAASQQVRANSVIQMADSALESVADIRATLGSYQNRFESIITNLANVSENTSAARSRIVDADIAAETSNMTKNAILQQAATAILAQANQQPQMALQLLG